MKLKENLVFELLSPFGISEKLCRNLSKVCSVQDITNDPYCILDIPEITFTMADSVAAKLGGEPDDPRRVRHGGEYVIKMYENSTGSTRMPIRLYSENLASLLRVPCDDLIMKTDWRRQVIFDRFLGQDTAARGTVDCAEKSIAEHLVLLSSEACPHDPLYIKEMISRITKELGIVLSDEQADACLMVARNRASIITGFPGTGKTTMIRVIAKLIQRIYGLECLCLAPTGIAARRIASCSELPASTIHSALKIYKEEGSASATLKNLMVIVDESSMLDTFLTDTLLSSLTGRTRIVFLGDPDQLESVRSGSILRDLLVSGKIPTSRLTKSFRSSLQSSDLDRNAAKIREGNTVLSFGRGYIPIYFPSDEDLETRLITLYLKAVRKFGMDSCILISPVKDGPAGVLSLNRRAREALNPPGRGKREITIGETTYRIGDRVMELKNTETSVNGDIGYVYEVDPISETMTVSFLSGEASVYKKNDGNRLTHAYALTVHKAQGSEFDVVICTLQDSCSFMLRRSIIYTAFTRARKFVAFVGSKAALDAAILNDDSISRLTGLEPFIRKEFEKRRDSYG